MFLKDANEKTISYWINKCSLNVCAILNIFIRLNEEMKLRQRYHNLSSMIYIYQILRYYECLGSFLSCNNNASRSPCWFVPISLKPQDPNYNAVHQSPHCCDWGCCICCSLIYCILNVIVQHPLHGRYCCITYFYSPFWWTSPCYDWGCGCISICKEQLPVPQICLCLLWHENKI